MITSRLNTREKYAVALAMGCIGIFLFLQLVVFPLINKQTRLKRALEVKIRTLAEVQELKAEFDALQQNKSRFQSHFATRPKGFTLFSFLERLANEAGVKDHIAYMKPSTKAHKIGAYKTALVEMKLRDISLKQLVTYLYMAETSKNMVSINRLAINKTGKQSKRLTAVLQVETIQM